MSTVLSLLQQGAPDEIIIQALNASNGNKDNRSNYDLRKDTDNYGRNALHFAAQKGRGEIVKLILSKDLSMVNVQDKKGKTAIQYACQENQVAVIEVLLPAQADPNLANLGGQSAAHYAAFKGNTTSLQLLDKCSTDFSAKNSEGQTPLHYACQSGNIDVVAWLIDSKKVNVNALTNDNSLPIHFAVAYQREAVVAFLLEHAIVIPSSVYDLETSETIDKLLEDSLSVDNKSSAEERKKRMESLTLNIPGRSNSSSSSNSGGGGGEFVGTFPSVLQTPVTPSFGPTGGPVFPTNN